MGSPAQDPLLDSKTVAYDFKMLCGVAGQLSMVDPENWVLYNSLTESFAIRCRALLCFFFVHDPASGFQRRPNDVAAGDFCPAWDAPWDHLAFGNPKWQADKHVAHITTDRQNVNLPGGSQSVWDIQSLLPHFIRLMEVFLAQAAGKLDVEAEAVIRNTIATFKALPPVPAESAATAATGELPSVGQVPTGYRMTAKTAPPEIGPSGVHRW